MPSKPLIVPLQTYAEKEHSKNKWSLVSVTTFHSQQVEIAWRFHLSNLSPVDNLLWAAIQQRSEYLRVASLNQISLNHGTRGACSLSRLQVWEVIKPGLNSLFSRIQRCEYHEDLRLSKPRWVHVDKFFLWISPFLFLS